MSIPRIIHQTWKTAEIPSEWQDCARSWRRFHPAWDHRLWTDADNLAFVARHYPSFLPVFETYSFPIQRVDAIRYLLLDHFGGVYVDLDLECLQPIGPLLEDRSFVAGYEPQSHADWIGRPCMVSNALMASTPGHPFLRAVIDVLPRRTQKIKFHTEVLESTGPVMLAEIHRSYSGRDVTVVEADIFSPLRSNDPRLKALFHQRRGAEQMKRTLALRGCYGIHYYSNSWVRTLGGDLSNPEPYNIDGHTFFAGEDSPGHDLGNFGRDVAHLARLSAEDPAVKGFNTDGYLKRHIRPIYRWKPLAKSRTNEGLYVKNEVLPRLRGRQILQVIRRLQRIVGRLGS